MRLLPSSLLLIGLLLWAPGCGEDAPVIRVQILTAPADGPVDVDLALLSAGPDRTRYPLRAVPGSEPGLMQAEAPTGFYFVHCAPGWDQLRVKPDAFEFVADASLAPRSVYVGRAGSFYLSMRDQDKPSVGLDWGLERVEPDGRRTPIEVQAFPAFDKVVGVRLPPSEWRGLVRLVGRRVDGRLLNPLEVDLGTPGPDRPRVRLMITAPTGSLGVRLVAPAGGTAVPDGYPVRVHVVGLPLVHALEASSSDGTAWFPDVPRIPEGVRVETGPATHTLPGPFVAARGVVHLLALDEANEALWTLTWPGEGPLDEVRVRPKGRRQYARAELVAPEAGSGNRVRVRTCRGPQHWLVRSGSRWAELDVDPQRGASGEARVATWTDGAQAQGMVEDVRSGAARPLPAGHRLLFVRTEGSAQVLGEGFDYGIDATGRYRVALPPGRYSVQVQGPRGLVGTPAALILAPGVSLRRSFEVD